MGNLERLLDALSRQLPVGSDRSTIARALKEAGKALPDSLTKTKAKLAQTEEACVDILETRFREAEAKASEAVVVEEVAAADTDVEEVKTDASAAAYQGVCEGDAPACFARCASLLQTALASLRSVELVSQALEGLIPLLPMPLKLGVKDLSTCAFLLSTAAATLIGHGEPPVSWSVFLGFIITAPVHVKGKAVGPAATTEAAKLGALVALHASRKVARNALRLGLGSLREAPGEAALKHFAPALVPVIGVAFGSEVSHDEKLVRGDLLALLHALRVISLCQQVGAFDAKLLSEARAFLRSFLEHRFDKQSLLPELRRLSLLPSKKGEMRKLSSGESAEIIAAAVTSMDVDGIKRLADCSGLPEGAGEQEETDRNALAAKARGDLFFEDVGQAGNEDNDIVEQAGAQVVESKLGVLEGVEALKPHKKKRKIARS